MSLASRLAIAALLLASPAPAQELVPGGSFDAGPGDWVDDQPPAAGAVSEWQAKGGRTGGAIHLALAGGRARSWSFALRETPPRRRIAISAWIRGAGVEGVVAICARGWSADRTRVASFASTQASHPLRGDFDWTRVETAYEPSGGSADVELLIFLAGTGDVWFDDVSAVAGDAVLEIVPGLFEARGEFTVTAESRSAPVLLVPLPLALDRQVPITYELHAVPHAMLESARVYEDGPANRIAEVVLRRLEPGDEVRIEWSSIVLAAPRDFPHAVLEAAVPPEWPAEARPWLANTRCVQAGDARIREVARVIRGASTDVLEIVRATLARCREIHAARTGSAPELDAVGALDANGSCTSNANLVAALLRAGGIPARIVAGYPAWSGPLQTHYVVEAWVPGFGWYPIESTLLTEPWPPCQQIQVSIVPPEHEDRSGDRPMAAGGVPYLSLTESKGEVEGWSASGRLGGVEGCDHVATPWRNFPADLPEEDWARALDRARGRWTSWLASGPALDETGTLRAPLGEEGLAGAVDPAALAEALGD